MLKIRKPQNKNNIMVKAVGILTKKSFNNRLKHLQEIVDASL